ncbi:MAG TPA: hypothetical protein VFQ68_13795 [Streptosporangiaceae bacterium]|nr:hypothetical protein [Streptosporangiaceae bacterium]
MDANLIWENHAAVAERLDDALRDDALREGRALAGEAVRRALAGGAAAIGWPEVADSLVHHRVRHLIVSADAASDPAMLGPQAQAALGWPSPEMLVERVVASPSSSITTAPGTCSSTPDVWTARFTSAGARPTSTPPAPAAARAAPTVAMRHRGRSTASQDRPDRGEQTHQHEGGIHSRMPRRAQVCGSAAGTLERPARCVPRSLIVSR